VNFGFDWSLSQVGGHQGDGSATIPGITSSVFDLVAVNLTFFDLAVVLHPHLMILRRDALLSQILFSLRTVSPHKNAICNK
jgi:hypothetical protein